MAAETRLSRTDTIPVWALQAARSGLYPARRTAFGRAPQRKEGAMDILDRLLGHDAWTTRQLLERGRSLPDLLLDQPFEFGHGGVRETTLHMVGNVEVWTDLMLARPVRRDHEQVSMDELLARHPQRRPARRAVARCARRAADTKHLRRRHHARHPAPMQHRVELLHMLARLGLDNLIEGDALSWEMGPGAATAMRREGACPSRRGGR
jgi:hypothetical protein